MTKPINILFIDDEASFTEPIAFWLKSKGYNVTTTTDGKEALQKIKDTPPDIVFLDLNMPEMSGLEILKEIRAFNKELPVIIITALYDRSENIARTRELGISGFFAKSYSFDQLVQMIHVTLKTHKKFHLPEDESQTSAQESSQQ